jgi:hypothetical protein
MLTFIEDKGLIDPEVSEVVETRLVTLTELETFRQTVYSQYTNLKSTLDASTLITITQGSSTSVITYDYEVAPGGIGWAIPSLSVRESIPSQPAYLPGVLTGPGVPGASTGSSTGSSAKSSTTASRGASKGASKVASGSVPGSTASSTSASITATITSFSSGLTAAELPGTTYTANDWITTTDNKHHTTLLPLTGIGGGRGIVFWDLPPLPNVEFTFPKFPNLPSLPRIHLPCIKVFGIHISGDCSDPLSSDGPSDNGGGGGNPPKSQPPDSTPTDNQPSQSEPSKSKPTNSQHTTTHSSTESTKSSTSACSVTKTASDCMVRCANTASVSSCTSYTTTFSKTVTGCSVQGTTTTSRIRACKARTVPIPESFISSLDPSVSSKQAFLTASTIKSMPSLPATNVAKPTTQPTTLLTLTTKTNSGSSDSSKSERTTGFSNAPGKVTPTIPSFSMSSSPPITSCSMIKVSAMTVDSFSYPATSKCTCNDGWGAGIDTTVGADKSTTYTCQVGTTLTIAVSTAGPLRLLPRQLPHNRLQPHWRAAIRNTSWSWIVSTSMALTGMRVSSMLVAVT